MSQRFSSIIDTSVSRSSFLRSSFHFLRLHLYLPVFALIALAGCLFYQHSEAIQPVNTTVGNRELPIYCVDTKEKKVALSFDAAWGNTMLLENHKFPGSRE